MSVDDAKLIDIVVYRPKRLEQALPEMSVDIGGVKPARSRDDQSGPCPPLPA